VDPVGVADAGDVRVTQPARDLRLPLDLLAAPLAHRLGARDLERDRAVLDQVARLPHLCEGAAAHPPVEPVLAEPRSLAEGHAMRPRTPPASLRNPPALVVGPR